MVLLETASDQSWYTIVTTALNVLQTIVLAYLAADRHNIQQMRKQGAGTRAEDATRP